MRYWIAAAAAVLATAPASGQERIAQPELPGFVVGHQLSNPRGSIEERIPQGETVQAWTKMVTVQRFAGVARQLRPDGLVGSMRDMLAQSCPGAVTTPISPAQVSGRPAATMRADCPLNPATGLPETFFVMAIGGAEDMHVAQVAFRSRPTEGEASWADAHLAAIRLCAVRSSDAECGR